jgi:hypothetical protein
MIEINYHSLSFVIGYVPKTTTFVKLMSILLNQWYFV